MEQNEVITSEDRLAHALVEFEVRRRMKQLELEEEQLQIERALMFQVLVEKPWTINKETFGQHVKYHVSDWFLSTRYASADSPEEAMRIAIDQEVHLRAEAAREILAKGENANGEKESN